MPFYIFSGGNDNMNCWFCGGKLIWGCDFSFDDYGIEGDGIVATLRCSNETCNADFEGYLRLDGEE